MTHRCTLSWTQSNLPVVAGARSCSVQATKPIGRGQQNIAQDPATHNLDCEFWATLTLGIPSLGFIPVTVARNPVSASVVP